MDASEFYEKAMQPDFPNGMNFQVSREADGFTFSREAIDNLMGNIQDFVLARIVAQWDSTKKAPNELKIHVRLDFKKHPLLDMESYPWHDVLDTNPGETKTIIDGSTRGSNE